VRKQQAEDPVRIHSPNTDLNRAGVNFYKQALVCRAFGGFFSSAFRADSLELPSADVSVTS
jgi:hypothetical protein